MHKDRKPWGECLHAFGGKVEVDIIDVKAGGYSSVHYHEYKDNLFVLLSGAMDILSFGSGLEPRDDEGYVSLVQLRERGDTVLTKAGEWHQFKVVEDAVVVEVYYVDIVGPVPGDIERSDTNGMMTSAELAEWIARDR